jgi:hypothetical protein
MVTAPIYGTSLIVAAIGIPRPALVDRRRFACTRTRIPGAQSSSGLCRTNQRFALDISCLDRASPMEVALGF